MGVEELLERDKKGVTGILVILFFELDMGYLGMFSLRKIHSLKAYVLSYIGFTLINH